MAFTGSWGCSHFCLKIGIGPQIVNIAFSRQKNSIWCHVCFGCLGLCSFVARKLNRPLLDLSASLQVKIDFFRFKTFFAGVPYQGCPSSYILCQPWQVYWIAPPATTFVGLTSQKSALKMMLKSNMGLKKQNSNFWQETMIWKLLRYFGIFFGCLEDRTKRTPKISRT